MNHRLGLFDLIGVLARRRYQLGERYFATLGLNHTEARLLTLLHKEGGATTQDALSNMLFLDRSNAGRALKSLEHEGCIERYRHDDDRRTNLVRMTATGREVVAKIANLRTKMVQEFFGDLSEEAAGELLVLLRKACVDEHDA